MTLIRRRKEKEKERASQIAEDDADEKRKIIKRQKVDEVTRTDETESKEERKKERLMPASEASTDTRKMDETLRKLILNPELSRHDMIMKVGQGDSAGI